MTDSTSQQDAPAPIDYDCVMYCLAHRRRLRWLAAPMWWHHVDDRRTCFAVYDMYAPRLPAEAATR